MGGKWLEYKVYRQENNVDETILFSTMACNEMYKFNGEICTEKNDDKWL